MFIKCFRPKSRVEFSCYVVSLITLMLWAHRYFICRWCIAEVWSNKSRKVSFCVNKLQIKFMQTFKPLKASYPNPICISILKFALWKAQRGSIYVYLCTLYYIFYDIPLFLQWCYCPPLVLGTLMLNFSYLSLCSCIVHLFSFLRSLHLWIVESNQEHFSYKCIFDNARPMSSWLHVHSVSSRHIKVLGFDFLHGFSTCS